MTELCLQEPTIMRYLPSIISASAIFLALYTMNQRPWNHYLQQTSGYQWEQLRECVIEIHQSHLRATTHGATSLRAIRDKYSHDKHLRVSLIPAKPTL
jgi:hypothetical protein